MTNDDLVQAVEEMLLGNTPLAEAIINRIRPHIERQALERAAKVAEAHDDGTPEPWAVTASVITGEIRALMPEVPS